MTTSDRSMKKVFLINETLLFEPELRRLGPVSGYPYRATTLHGPVSECLFLLLENNEQVVTQRFFFSSVWEKQGTIVSTNALYQTISQIRKALKFAGLEENIIKTLPKEGFKSIARLRTGDLAEFVSPQKTVPDVLPAEESAEPDVAVIVAPVAPASHPKSRWFNSRLAYGAAGILFLLSCGYLYSVIKVGATELTDYQFVGKLNSCEVFSSWQDKEKSREMFMKLSARYAIQCQTGGTAWMTVNFAQQGSSVIVCDRSPRDKRAQCDSIIYRQQFNDE